jgi:hypothetical protein
MDDWAAQQIGMFVVELILLALIYLPIPYSIVAAAVWLLKGYRIAPLFLAV